MNQDEIQCNSTVLVSNDHHNKLPQDVWLKTIEIYCLLDLETEA